MIPRRSAEPIGRRPRWPTLAAVYMTNKAATKRPSSLRDDRSMWGTIVLPLLGKRRVKSVTAQDVETLHKSREATPYRANRVLALLSSAFSLAVRWGWRSDNPARGIERFHEDRRERYLNPDELARLVEALNNHPNRRAANAVRLLLLTGARRSEVLGASWDQFDLEGGIWTKPSAHTKQKRNHRVPLPVPVRALLAGMRAEAGQADVPSSFLFPGDAPGKSLGDIKHFWRSVCARADLRGVRLHDLRHQYASMLGERRRVVADHRPPARPHPACDHGPLCAPVRRSAPRSGRARRKLVQNTGEASGLTPTLGALG